MFFEDDDICISTAEPNADMPNLDSPVSAPAQLDGTSDALANPSLSEGGSQEAIEDGARRTTKTDDEGLEKTTNLETDGYNSSSDVDGRAWFDCGQSSELSE